MIDPARSPAGPDAWAGRPAPWRLSLDCFGAGRSFAFTAGEVFTRQALNKLVRRGARMPSPGQGGSHHPLIAAFDGTLELWLP